MEKSITKKNIIEQIYLHCKKNNNYVFDNELVKNIVKSSGSNTNPYDMTKLDDTSKFPDILLKDDYFVAHIGEGKHKFVKGISKAFHTLEPINEDEVIQYPYRPSLLNDYSTSESSVLSLCNNHRITHDFLYSDIVARPKIYNSERKNKVSFQYYINSEKMEFENLQIEIDSTIEYQGVVTVFEGKNARKGKWIDNFNVFQLYNPYRYYMEIKEKKSLEIKEIYACYLIQQKQQNGTIVRLYLYYFENPLDITTIKLQKKREYRLSRRGFDGVI